MCGIIGFSSKKNYNFNKIQTLSLCNSYDRGGDSTGFYTPSTGIIKDVSTAHDFIIKGLYSKLKPDNTLIGHFRKSSVGANTLKNAHPFENQSVILCHNGTLRNYIKLATNYNIKHDSYDTDSQVLAQAISNYIVDSEKEIDNSVDKLTDVPSVLYDYEGAAALLWYDNATEIMYAYRDDQRPLYYGIVNGSMYISSLEYSLNIIGCKNIKQFTENVLYIIKEGKIIRTISKRESNYCKLGTESDFRVWAITGYKYKPNLEFTGIKSESRLVEYLDGFLLKYKDNTIKPKVNNHYYTGSGGTYLAAMTKGKSYEILGYQSSFLWVKDDNGEDKQVLYSSFDISNVFPVVGRYCTVNGTIVRSKTDHVIAVEGDILKVLGYNFKDSTFKATILKTNETFTIPISCYLPYSDREYLEVITKLGEVNNINSNESKIEIIEEDEIPWYIDEDEDNCSADGSNWIHFDDVESYNDVITEELETIMDEYEKGDDIKHRLGNLYDIVVGTYNKEKFEKLILNEKV